jgi:hydroxypyruvate isomerase
MPKFAANLSLMFGEHAFLDRFAAAAAVGFRAVEYLFPYPYPKEELRARLEAHGLEQVLFNAGQGDWDKGERGIGGLPGRETEFRRAIETALDYAAALGCPRLHVMAGLVPAGTDPRHCREVFVENLRWALGLAAPAGVTLLLEPLNPIDVPGYLIGSPAAARSLIDEIASPHLKLQYDVYHAQMTHGRLIDSFAAHREVVGHVQIAGVPGRHEPDHRQEINYPAVFAALDEAGYDGWIGCEYRPRGATRDGLGWAAGYGIGGDKDMNRGRSKS